MYFNKINVPYLPEDWMDMIKRLLVCSRMFNPKY